MKQSLALRVGQTLTMTPALQQAIRLLQLSSLDLQQEIRQALESNVMLEADGEEGEGGEEPAAASSSSGSGDDDGLHDYLQANLHGSASLREHLVWQASIAPFDPLEAEIALHLVDAVNDDGYLEDWES